MSLEPLLIRMPNWLGDVVMATSALEALHRSGRYELTLLVREPWDHLFRADPRVRDIIVCRDRGAGIFSTASAIRPGRFSTVVDFTHSARSWILWKLAGVQSVRRKTPSRGQNGVHQVVRYMSVIQSMLPDHPPVPRPPHIFAPPTAAGDSHPPAVGSFPEILLFPGAAYGPAKQWSVERYQDLVRNLLDRGHSVCLTGTAAEKPLLESIAPPCQSSVVSTRSSGDSYQSLSLSAGLLLPDLARLIAASTAVISCDSGAAHLAAALGKPVVVLFFSTDPHATAPIGFAVRPLAAAVPCRPCFLRTCPIGYLCRDSITPSHVLSALDDLLDAPARV